MINKYFSSVIFIVGSFLTLTAFLSNVVRAQTPVAATVNPAVAPFSDIGALLGNVFSVVLILASILLFLYLLLGGIQWLTSGGDKAATQAARDRITAALTGLLIILAVWGIFTILEKAFGISVLGGIKLPIEATNRYKIG